MRIVENPPSHFLEELQEMLGSEPGIGIVDFGTVMESVYVVAEEADAPLGVATIIREPFYELHKLYVAPRYRHRGVGQLLVSHAISMASANGAEELLIEIAGQSGGFWERVTAGRRIVSYGEDKFGILLG